MNFSSKEKKEKDENEQQEKDEKQEDEDGMIDFSPEEEEQFSKEKKREEEEHQSILPSIQTIQQSRTRRGNVAQLSHSASPLEVSESISSPKEIISPREKPQTQLSSSAIASSKQPLTRSRGRREAFYHAQQPKFNDNGQCIAIGSTIQLPRLSFTCKITQKGIVKIGDGILPEEAIVQLNDVEVGIAQTIGKKQYMEDTVCVFETNIPYLEVIGVFDGHNGDEAALELAKETGNLFKKALKEKKKHVREALELVFDYMHQRVAEKTESGSTASLVCIEGSKVYVAHVGDSPVFLVRRNTPEKLIEKVTINHHPDLVEERERIEKSGGHCFKIGNIWRVEGVIALSRSIGDRKLHPSLTHVPDINEFDLTDVTEIVITSDGVTDVLNEEDIHNIVVKSINVDTAANGIRDLAYKKNSGDNITSVVIKLPK